jgi:hypothetical protein
MLHKLEPKYSEKGQRQCGSLNIFPPGLREGSSELLWSGKAQDDIHKWFCASSSLDSPPQPSPAQGFAENTLLHVTLLFFSVLSVFHLGWKGNSEADNYIADVGFLEEN